ncbi:MAG: hypothetical protein OXJ36_09875 [bacterium]|nr:hypothetical protein [bacterium]MDE0438688.1 hypothetical protein [bacterium]
MARARASLLADDVVVYGQESTLPQKGTRVKETVLNRAKRCARSWSARMLDEYGAAETSTILAWIVVGVLVVFALQQGLEEAGTQVIDWIKAKFKQ